MSWIILHADTPTSRSAVSRVAHELPDATLTTPVDLRAGLSPVHGVVVDASSLDLARVAGLLGRSRRLEVAPLIALVANPTEGAVSRAIEAGADDIVPAGDLRALSAIRHELEGLARAGQPLVRARRSGVSPAPRDPADQRLHLRAPHETLCSYRLEGEMWPRFACTWDVSEGGVFVRSLAPPPSGERVWIELRPPGAMRAVHLRGTVVWRSPASAPIGRRAPVGFGLRLDHEAGVPEDIADFITAARALAHRGRRVA